MPRKPPLSGERCLHGGHMGPEEESLPYCPGEAAAATRPPPPLLLQRARETAAQAAWAGSPDAPVICRFNRLLWESNPGPESRLRFGLGVGAGAGLQLEDLPTHTHARTPDEPISPNARKAPGRRPTPPAVPLPRGGLPGQLHSLQPGWAPEAGSAPAIPGAGTRHKRPVSTRPRSAGPVTRHRARLGGPTPGPGR